MARLRDRMLSNTILQPSLYENDVNGHVVVAMTSEFVLIDAVYSRVAVCAVFNIPDDVLDPHASLWSVQTPFQISPYIPDPGVVHTIHLYMYTTLT